MKTQNDYKMILVKQLRRSQAELRLATVVAEQLKDERFKLALEEVEKTVEYLKSKLYLE